MRNFLGLLSTRVHFDLSWWLHVTIHWNQDWLLLAFAKIGNSHLQERLGDWSLVQYQAYPQKIPALIFYCGIAHEFEYLSNHWACLEALYPALALCALLKISWLVHQLVRLSVCSLVSQIETNDFPELDFQQQGSGLWTRLYYLPKERLKSAPRALQKPPLHPILSISLLFNKKFKRSQFLFCWCNLAKPWVW